MTYGEACERLFNHAGLPHHGAGVCIEDGFAYLLSRSPEGGMSRELVRAFEDIIDCLECVNRELNGAPPSQIVHGKQDTVDRRLAGAVAEILSKAWECCSKWGARKVSDEVLRHLVDLTWAISDGWLAVLHGDFDSIRDEVRNEAQSRRVRSSEI